MKLSMVVAYFILGLAGLVAGLCAPIRHKPGWAYYDLTVRITVWVITMWPLRTLVKFNKNAESIVSLSGTLAVLKQMAIMTGVIWCCIAFAKYIFDSPTLQVFASVIFIMIVDFHQMIRTTAANLR